MNLEKLDRRDLRLIVACVVIGAVSLVVGIRYYFLAFPEASIEFRVTKESSRPVATSFLGRMGVATSGYRHAAVFGFDDQQKTFLERELGVEESNRLLATTVRLWRWKHRWFRPLQKEEASVEVTTKGEVVGFRHLLAEDVAGADLPVEAARKAAETFLAETVGRPIDRLSFVEGSLEKRPHRTDHSFTWKVKGSEVHGADYRVEVGIAGSGVASYAEFLKVPDTWIRDYAKLRSKNEIAGQIDSVLLLLTGLAMLVLLVRRIRRGDVRWRAAGLLGGLIFVLLSVSQLNQLPSAFYAYDTTTSFGGFVLGGVLRAFGAGLGAGLLIFLVAASAEPLYRERFPRFLSLTSLLRPRALRTREFFLASLVGVTLTCFFFAYENVFYLIANRCGAWAPRDVAYSDLLSTSFPWVYVLFFGFLPAISEEFISRMFSIPFFERILRSTAAAIVIAAFIWGFGHAAYPNQPFWIRGLEVGIAGIVFGLVMLRFGIASVVICHFSVDALYTAFVLIRSPNLYYRISGSLSAGIFVLLLLAAAAAYLFRGGFRPAEDSNADEGVPPPAEPQEAAAAGPAPAVAYRPLPRRRILWGLVVAVILAALPAVPVAYFGDGIEFRATRGQALDAASAFLRSSGFDVASYRTAVALLDRTDPTAASYLLKSGGLDAANRLYASMVPTPLWRVRFFVPGQKQEYGVSVSVATGDVVGFERTLLESAPGASLSKERALEVARAFLVSHGIDPAAGEIKEQSEKDEKARRDHTLVWEFPESGAGKASARHEVVVQGDVVGSWGRTAKIPEEWRRDRERQTAITVVFRWLALPFFGLLGVLALLLLISRIRAGVIPWRFAFAAGGVAAAATLARMGLSLDTFWSRYDTSIPAGGYLIVILVSVLLGTVVFFFAGTIVAGFAGSLYSQAASMLRRQNLRAFGRDALLAGFVALGFALGAPALLRLLQAAIPAGRLVSGITGPTGIESKAPFLFSLLNTLSVAVFVPAIAAIAAGVLSRSFKRPIARVLLACFFVLSFLPGPARTAPEYALGALSLIVVSALVLGLVLCFLRDNPLAWVWCVWFGRGGAAGIQLLTERSGAYRLQGALVVVVVLVSAGWLAVESARRDRPALQS
ncbi:MAG: CPBP family intramembrane metalloprotease [Acidobacteriia bacterium]|nr:CPBP family intramembrane metalloprotease [Terriglobia bacterium]